MINRFINIGLRGLTLVSKFLIIVLLAKLLPTEQVGLYGLLTVTISYSLFVVGFDFYTYSTREMIARPKAEWLGILRDQAVFYLLTYLICLPLLALAFTEGFLPSTYWPWFAGLLVLEHAAQEINRILVAAQQQTLASVVLFIRSGSWCWIATGIMWQYPQWRAVETVLAAWVSGASLACLLGAFYLLRYDRQSLSKKIDWHWIKKGIKVAAPMLLASLTIRGIYTLDRYWIEHIFGLAVLGPYALFMGIAGAVSSFIDAAIISFAYPQLLASASSGQHHIFRQQSRRMALNILISLVLLSAICWMLAPLVLGWIGRSEYHNNLPLLGWLLLANMFYNLSIIPHYALYAYHHDQALVIGNILGFVVFILAIAQASTVTGVAQSLCVAFASMWLSKYVMWRRSS